MIRIVVQQPQFLPWAGLWFKAVSADVYVIYAGVKFDQGDHQHRVTINGSWVTLPVESGQRNALIKDVQLAENFHQGLDKIVTTIRQTCMAKRFKYGDRLGRLVSILEGWSSKWMLDLNLALHCELLDVFGIQQELYVDTKVRAEEKIDKLDDCLLEYMHDQPFMYLAGGGGLDYMGYDSLRMPAETRFQRMRPGVSPDSMLQSIARNADPLVGIRNCAVWETREGKFYECDGTTPADFGPAH